MGIGSASWRLFLHMLIAMCINGIGSAELARKHLEGLQGPRGKDNTDVLIRLYDSHGHPIDDPAHQGTHGGPVHTHPTSHVDHMDPSSMIFFTLKDLQVGKTIPIYFRKRDPSSSPRFLPREKADSIPFSSKELPNLLEFFSLSPGSPQAKAMEHALRHCESKPIKRETKFCATSLESMLDFVRSVLGLKSPFQALTTSLLSKSTTDFQNYTILKTPVEVSAPKMVACHSLPYPYAIFYCHSQETENKVFKVRLVGENGDGVEAIAVCHMDTSEWNPDHVSFRVLGVQPGTSPVCHFFPADNLVWVPTPLSI